MAFLKNETVGEMIMKAILKVHTETQYMGSKAEDIVAENAIQGKIDLKFMIWSVHRETLEKLFKYPVRTYQEMERQYV